MNKHNQFFGAAFSTAFATGAARGQSNESRQGEAASVPLASVTSGSHGVGTPTVGNEAFAFSPRALGRALMHRV
jgi:hypothetical protein